MIDRGLIQHSDRILVAVSGGPDSAALLHLLVEMGEEFGLQLEVAHLQHGIRGEDAREDARFVAALAQTLGLPFHLKEIDLPALKAEAGKGNLEALARAERYRFFADLVRARKLDKVATAHTEDDQAETILMWMLRGAGMKGLCGMAPLGRMEPPKGERRESLLVVRPLLEISKAEILAYLQERKLSYRLDRTNQDPALLRNWIRLELLPAIEHRAGYNVARRLGRQAELLRDENEFLDGLARERADAMRDAGGIKRDLLRREPKALQRRILRLWIEQVRGYLRGLDFVHVDDLLRLIESKTPQGRLSIGGGWELVREYDTLRLEQRPRNLKRPCYGFEFKIGMTLRIADAGIMLVSKLVDVRECQMPDGLMEAMFDLDALPVGLSVRNFRHGDRLKPLGMSGHKKVKTIFIDKKVPLSVRATLPLLATASEILWIPGYARSRTALITDRTTSTLQIKAVPIDI
jgi:tRNA(Ile)-lysidine synthase